MVDDTRTERRDAETPLVLAAERPGLDRYLEDTIVVDWQTPTVLERARSLVAGHDGELERIESLFAFVRDEISHSLDVDTDLVPCTASQVLRDGTGLCYAKSHLLVALLRSRGIPAGFGYQRLREEAPTGRFVLHGFAAAWLGERQTWLVLDARGDNDDIHTEVDVDRPSFAYAPDEDAGEITYPIVWARPSKRVVDLLDQADSLTRIKNHLPDSIET